MIGLFNIPCHSPLEIQRANCRFDFELDPTFVAIFSDGSSHHRQAKYNLDGRKLSENGQPILPISTNECWEHLIWGNKLIEQSAEMFNNNKDNGQMEELKIKQKALGNGQFNMEDGEEGKEENNAQKKSSIPTFLENFIDKFCRKRRQSNSSLFYLNLDELEEIKEQFEQV